MKVGDDVPLVVMRVEGDWFAVRNTCPHAGLPLGEGDLRGHVLTCPFHGYAYNIKNGRNIDWPEDEMPVKTFPVRIKENTVQIELAEPKKKNNSAEPTPDNEKTPKPTPKPDEDCDPSESGGDPSKPDCPTGYPEEKPTG